MDVRALYTWSNSSPYAWLATAEPFNPAIRVLTRADANMGEVVSSIGPPHYQHDADSSVMLEPTDAHGLWLLLGYCALMVTFVLARCVCLKWEVNGQTVNSHCSDFVWMLLTLFFLVCLDVANSAGWLLLFFVRVLTAALSLSLNALELLANLIVISQLVTYVFASLQWWWLLTMGATIWEYITPSHVLDLLGATFLVGCVGKSARPYLVLLLALLYTVAGADVAPAARQQGIGTCPNCHGNAAGCTWAADSSCPLVTLVMANAAVITATVVGTLSLTNLIKPRFLRAFAKASLDAIMAYKRRPVPGTVFVIERNTNTGDILQAVTNGQYTIELALMRIAELYDGLDTTPGHADARIIAKLDRDLKILDTARNVLAFVDSPTSSFNSAGVYTYVWAKISNFVHTKEVGNNATTFSGPSEATQAAPGTSHAFSATAAVLATMEECAESMNLFLLFITCLGLSSTPVVCDFYEAVFYDTIRMRHHPWQLGLELMRVMMRHVEDSDGSLNLGNVYDNVHLNSVLDEAVRNLEVNYPGAATVFFRTRAGTAQPSKQITTTTEDVGVKKVWNSKSTSSSTYLCPAFNNGHEHQSKALQANGTCKRAHKCDHWVNNKGVSGRCMGTEGTPGHARTQCDNPHKCTEPKK